MKERDYFKHGQRQGYLRVAREVAKMRKTLAVKSQDLNLILRTLKRANSCMLSFVFHMNSMACASVFVLVCVCACVHAHVHITNKNND